MLGLSGPRPPKIFNQLNLLLLKVHSLWSCAHYFQWFMDYFKPCWLTDATCNCFKETALLLNVHLGCFVNFIKCPTDKYVFKVNNEKIRLICWMCSKLKSNTTWHCSNVFIVDWPESVYQYSVSTLNFEQVFFIRVWKTCHNVLKMQKTTYLFRDKSCKVYFIQRFYHCTESK